MAAVGAHQFEIIAVSKDVLELALGFSTSDEIVAPAFDDTVRAADAYWARFWTDGAALDLLAAPTSGRSSSSVESCSRNCLPP
jgi:hypothetical protein